MAKVQIPGEVTTASAEIGAPDPKDVEIAALKAQLAAKSSVPSAAADAIVRPGTGPHIDEAMARSKHKHLTGAELHAQIKAGKADLEDQRMVLCSDGWYVNPKFVKREDDRDRRG